MVLKDVFCTVCERIERDAEVSGCSWVGGERHCVDCGDETTHRVVCNGGASRESTDWSYEKGKGQVEYLGTEAYKLDKDGNKIPYTQGDGSLVSAHEKYQREAIKEREQRNESARRHRMGRQPLFFLPKG